MNLINLNQVLEIFNSGEVFSVRFVTFDKKRKTGGEIVEMKSVVGRRKFDKSKPKSAPSGGVKNHFINGTRTVLKVADGTVTSAVRSIHIFLILEVNGKKMVL